MALNATDIGSGLDHADIPAWIASITTATDSYVGTCQTAVNHSGGSNFTYNGTAPTGGNYRTLTSDTDVRMTLPTLDSANNAARVQHTMTVTTAGLDIEYMCWTNNGNNIDMRDAVNSISRCYFRKTVRGITGGSGGTTTFTNCLFLIGSTSGIGLWTLTSGFTWNVYHTTLISSGPNSNLNTTGVSTVNIYACISMNSGSGNAYDTRANGDENVASDTTSSFCSTTEWPSEDAVVDSTSTVLKNDPTIRRSKRSTYAVSDYSGSVDVGTDFFGNTRSAGVRHAGAIQPPATPTNTLLDNLVDWWQGDESVATANMVSDTGNIDLVQTSDPAVDKGIAGGSRSLDGSNDYFQEATHSADLAGNQEFYAAGWVRTEDLTGTQALWGQQNSVSGSTSSWGVNLNGNTLQFRLYDGTTNDGPDWGSNFVADQWMFVEAGYNPSTDEAFICVNRGVDVTDSMATTGTIQEGSEEMTVGAFSNTGGKAQGWFCALGFWSAIPSTANRNALYNSRHGLDYADFSASGLRRIFIIS